MALTTPEFEYLRDNMGKEIYGTENFSQVLIDQIEIDTCGYVSDGRLYATEKGQRLIKYYLG